MKKFTVTLLFGLLILAFGATAYGQPKLDFRASGFIDVVTNWYTNVTPGNPGATIWGPGVVAAGGVPAATPADPDGTGFNRGNAWLATRGRLKFDAIMEKALSGTFFFEIDSSRWGERAPGNNDDRNYAGMWNGDRGAMELKNMYFDFGLPYFGVPVPMTMRAGLQPLSIRPGLLVYTDGMGISGGLDIAPVKIQPLWFKAIEGKDWSSDDVDVYGIHGNARISTFTIGGYGLYYNMNTYPFTQTSLTAGTKPSYSSDMWWFGAYADGKAGPFDLNFDFIYDYGSVDSRLSAPARDVDYRGWMTRLRLDYGFEKFNFGAVGMYATGADSQKTSSTGLPGSLTSLGTQSRKVNSYVVPPGSESGAIFGESLVVYSTWVNRGTTGIGCSINTGALARGPTGGTWLAKLYGSYKATPWYKVTLAGLYIGDTTDHGDTFGTALGTTGLHDGNSIGWELDLYNEFQVYKNLSFVVAGGYLWAGSAMKFSNGGVAGVSYFTENPRNPWLVTTALTYNF